MNILRFGVKYGCKIIKKVITTCILAAAINPQILWAMDHEHLYTVNVHCPVNGASIDIDVSTHESTSGAATSTMTIGLTTPDGDYGKESWVADGSISHATSGPTTSNNLSIGVPGIAGAEANVTYTKNPDGTTTGTASGNTTGLLTPDISVSAASGTTYTDSATGDTCFGGPTTLTISGKSAVCSMEVCVRCIFPPKRITPPVPQLSGS